MHGQPATGKIQRNNYHHGSYGPSLTGKTMSVFLIFTQGTHWNVKNRGVKATSHSTIFDIPMRPLREDQKHRHRFTRKRRPATLVMVIIPLNSARCSLPTHRNR